jgi:hypothetical protein
MNRSTTNLLANNTLVNFDTNAQEQRILVSEIKVHNTSGIHGTSEHWQGIYWLCMFSRHF